MSSGSPTGSTPGEREGASRATGSPAGVECGPQRTGAVGMAHNILVASEATRVGKGLMEVVSRSLALA